MRGGGWAAGTTARRGAAHGEGHASERAPPGARAAGMG
jgi:hypothetical protein